MNNLYAVYFDDEWILSTISSPLSEKDLELHLKGKHGRRNVEGVTSDYTLAKILLENALNGQRIEDELAERFERMR